MIDYYDDILTAKEKSFSATFKKFSQAAQRLYVRLISRKGPHFRSDRLNYPEIGTIAVPANELQEGRFLAIDEYEIDEVLLNILRVDEMRELVQIDRSTPSARLRGKDRYREYILQNTDEASIRDFISARFQVFAPQREQELETYRLLFFGNLHQDLTEFVLLDLGIQRFESYSFSKEDRLFKSRHLLDTTHEIIKLEQSVRLLIENHEHESLRQILPDLPDPLAEPRLIRRLGRILNKLGRYFERLDDYPTALFSYRLTEQPPSRERQVRILEKMGLVQRAHILCERIQRQPIEESELQFAERWLAKIEKKLKSRAAISPERSSEPSARPDIQFRPKILTVRLKNRYRADSCQPDNARGEKTSVESVVLSYFQENGWQGFYSQNFFWSGLFGLAFWDIIFMPIHGAFFNMFQRGPVDLFLPDFRLNREEAIGQRLQKILTEEEWEQHVLQTYDLKHKVSNYLVNWNLLTREYLELALGKLDREHLVAIFDRMSKNLHENTNGFPDLLLFRITEPNTTDIVGDDYPSYVLVEVKSPNDQVQQNQMRWLKFFHAHAIPSVLAKVIWLEE